MLTLLHIQPSEMNAMDTIDINFWTNYALEVADEMENQRNG